MKNQLKIWRFSTTSCSIHLKIRLGQLYFIYRAQCMREWAQCMREWSQLFYLTGKA